ncbi:MAG: L,D-transpeptidase, partial [Actinobacteria bacterium]|nr:L,D-transpeptidase [Actinomycetota bacterium]
STDPTTSTPSASPSTAAADAAPVHVSLLEGDGGVYGVGMPIIAYVDRAVTDASAFDKATKVTVNGKPAAGAWYWEKSGRKGQALEAHYRLSRYWPAHAKIFLDLPVKGLSAGKALAFDDSLTLSISTGPANVSTVDCAAEKFTVTSDAKTIRTMPVSCGKAKTPTYTGTKVVMQKGEQVPGKATLRPEGTVRMVSNNPADPYDLMVPWSVRLTNSGEYAHAASWNGGNIGIRSTSNGCTNLNVNDAKWFYQFSQLGDVVTYANTGGTRMPSWDGYGDWNLPWATWQVGGIVPSGN